MSSTSATARLPLSHPLAGPLLSFCLLPSRLLHVSRRSAGLPAEAAALGENLAHWHRHQSAGMLRQQALAPAELLVCPALPIALLPDTAWQQLQLLGGLTLAGQRLRRCIRKADVAWLRERWGDALLDFVRQRAAALHPGLEAAVSWSLEETAAQIPALGVALIERAFADAAPPIAERACWRLPLDKPCAIDRAMLPNASALRLALSLTEEINPQWLSLFPAIH